MFNIEIKIDTKALNELGKLPEMTRKAMKNIIRKSTDVAYNKAQQRLAMRYFEGDLLRSLRKRVYYGIGYVGIEGSPQLIKEARLNEEGPIPGLYNSAIPLYISQATPKLQRWMNMVGVRKLSKGLGGPNTNWGKRNRFLTPAWVYMMYKLPNIIEQEMRKLK